MDYRRHYRATRAPEQVCLYQSSTLPLGVDPNSLVRALQAYVDDFLAPVWGVSAELRWTDAPVPGAMNVAFVDDTDDANTIAYHEDATDKSPDAIVSITAAYESHSGLALPTSHELAEMLVNPGTNLWAGATSFVEEQGDGADLSLRALEVADPVEEYSFLIDGFQMSDFVYPAYFEPWRDGPVDLLGVISRPLEIAAGGYQIVRNKEVLSTVQKSGYHKTERCYRHKVLTRPPRRVGHPSRCEGSPDPTECGSD
jgi:hypothetical protein